MAVKPVPEGYHTVTPYLIIQGASQALDFYKQAFAAEELVRMGGPNGKIGHAEIKIGDSMIMLADEHPEMGYRGPKAYGGSPVGIHLYINDVDSMFRKTIAAGAKELRPLKDQFYGDRSATLEDPFGHVWTISTHKEDVSPDEMERRIAAYMKEQAAT